MEQKKYSLRRKIRGFVVLIFAIFAIVDTYRDEEKPKAEYRTLKVDPNRPVYEINKINYETGEVEYYDFSAPPPKQQIEFHSGVEDLILDKNLEIENLIEYQID